ncbi:hypothetical protein SETIT_9G026900v2 [Setaria italica]|uniref:PIR2-like helical domain-containing protein n=2 Tax=Setaria italica TaxID=4555 RepID=A0A368SCP6_SETIT|nr:hypothetical protein SETIT_9G026900v2 [Setaria italica]
MPPASRIRARGAPRPPRPLASRTKRRYLTEVVASEKSQVIAHIRQHYKRALKRLPPSLIPRVAKAGVCIGFLDPVCNIIANTVSYKEEEQGPRHHRQRSLRRGAAGQDREGQQRRGTMPRRARRLLTSYFRYLTAWEALYYLRRSRADLLVAVHLVEEDHATRGFALDHPTTKVALACAARSAMHPRPDAFMSASVSLASRRRQMCSLLAPLRPISDVTAERISRMSDEGLQPPAAEPHQELMRLAAARTRAFTNVPPPVELQSCFEQSTKKVLMDKIHGFYLEAISRIPKTLLRSRLHRALLKAGHCYGPFEPVGNILVNTIWYDAAFPTSLELEVDMIRNESLAIAESCSLHGLVAFLRALGPEPDDELSTPGNLWNLLLHNACILDKCISTAPGLLRESSITEFVAYRAAAVAAYHPNPAALAHFAAVLLPAVVPALEPLLSISVPSPLMMSRPSLGLCHEIIHLTSLRGRLRSSPLVPPRLLRPSERNFRLIRD